MGGPARRVVEYNFEHYRKISKRELGMGFFTPFSLQKENFVVQFAMRIFRKFCQSILARGGVWLRFEIPD